MEHSDFIKIEQYVQGVIDALPEGDYDKTHTLNVVSNARVLATDRNLDPLLGQTICLLHDMGRVLGIKGELHSMTGAAYALSLLEDSKVDMNEMIVIHRSIANHSNKWMIGDAYEELLKDCDSLTHAAEFGDAYKKSEAIRVKVIRVKAMKANNFRFEYSGRNPDELFLKLYDELLMYDDFETLEGIHQLRIKIRTMRSLLSFCGVKNEMDMALKNMFKLLDEPRKLDVFCETYKQYDINIKKILKRRSVSYEKMKQKMPDRMAKVREAAIPSGLKFSKNQILSNYFNLIASIGGYDDLDLHELRIVGKRLKYMIESSMLISCEDDIKAISILHKVIGNYHDAFDHLNLINQYGIKMTKSMKKAMAQSKKENLKKIKEGIFYFRLRLRYY